MNAECVCLDHAACTVECPCGAVEVCSVEPAFSQHEYAVSYCETHDQPADICAAGDAVYQFGPAGAALMRAISVHDDFFGLVVAALDEARTQPATSPYVCPKCGITYKQLVAMCKEHLMFNREAPEVPA